MKKMSKVLSGLRSPFRYSRSDLSLVRLYSVMKRRIKIPMHVTNLKDEIDLLVLHFGSDGRINVAMKK